MICLSYVCHSVSFSYRLREATIAFSNKLDILEERLLDVEEEEDKGAL